MPIKTNKQEQVWDLCQYCRVKDHEIDASYCKEIEALDKSLVFVKYLVEAAIERDFLNRCSIMLIKFLCSICNIFMGVQLVMLQARGLQLY